MRFGGVPGQFLFAKESEEHDCDTDIGQKRKILIVEMGEIVDETLTPMMVPVPPMLAE